MTPDITLGEWTVQSFVQRLLADLILLGKCKRVEKVRVKVSKSANEMKTKNRSLFSKLCKCYSKKDIPRRCENEDLMHPSPTIEVIHMSFFA